MNLYESFTQKEVDCQELTRQLQKQQDNYSARAREIKAQAERQRKRFGLNYLIVMSILILGTLIMGAYLLSFILAIMWWLNDGDEYFMIFSPRAYKKLHTSECGWMYSEVDAKELEPNYQEVKATEARLNDASQESYDAEIELITLLRQSLPLINFDALPKEAQTDLKQYLAYYCEDMMEEENFNPEAQTPRAGGEERE